MPHTTGLGLHPSPHGIPIEVHSGGLFTSGVGSAEIIIDGKRLWTQNRGLLVAVIDTLGRVESEQWEMLNQEYSVQKFENYIKSVPKSSTVIIASRTMNTL